MTASVMCIAGVVIVLAATTLGISPLGGVLGPATADPPTEQARGAIGAADERVIDRAPPVAVTEPEPAAEAELAATPVAPVAAAALPTGDRERSSAAAPPADQSTDQGAEAGEDPAVADSASVLSGVVLEPLTEHVVVPVVSHVVEPVVEHVVEPLVEQVVQPLVQTTVGLLDGVLSTLTGATSLVGGLLGG